MKAQAVFRISVGFLFSVLNMIATAQPALGQQVGADNDTRRQYQLAVEHVQKKKYAAAQQLFARSLEHPDELSSMEQENADYYRALCALVLFNENGEALMIQFAEKYPEHPKVSMAYFHLGLFSFSKHKFNKSLKWFSLVDQHQLDRNEKTELHFKSGYAHFRQDEMDAALKEFVLVGDDIEEPYATPGNYYTAYILFSKKEYDSALERFSLLEDDATFGKIVPLYVLQILKAQGKEEEAIAYGERFMGKKFSDFSDGNLRRLIGESYFDMGEFSMAVPYLEEAMNRLKWDRDLCYRSAYAAYRSGDFKKAVTYFEKVAEEPDRKTQMAYGLMADAYMKMGDRLSAWNAYKQASEMDADDELKETSLFNFAKLSLAMAYDPQNSAIREFENYIDKHQNIQRADEAHELIMDIRLSAHDYEGAMRAIEKIDKPKGRLQKTYQQSALKRGKELFNDGDFAESIDFFQKATTYNADRLAATEAVFWQAEALSALNRTDSAIDKYRQFMQSSNAARTEVFNLSQYGLAYAYLSSNRTEDAIPFFQKYIELEHADRQRIGDAYLRLGDCNFSQKRSGKAIAYYNRAIAMNTPQADYALFQIAMSLGIQGRPSSKIQKLQTLLKNHPASGYGLEVQYRIGETYFLSNRPDEAIAWFDRVIASRPHSRFVAKSLLNKAMISYNSNDDETAVQYLKQVAQDFSGTSEAAESLSKVRQIYIDNGRVGQYEEFLHSNNLPNARTGSLDTSYYESALASFDKGEWHVAQTSFKTYLDKFPNGSFAIDAHYHRAEASMRSEQYDDALQDLNKVLEYAGTIYTENACLMAAGINMRQEQFEAARSQYALLEEMAEQPENVAAAQTGLMRTNSLLSSFDEAERYADKLLQNGRTDPAIADEARLILAKSALQTDRSELALTRFEDALKQSNGAAGAEAMYNIASIQFGQSDYAKSQQTVLNLVNRFAHYPNWIGKGFLLLAENYVKQNDLFQAKLTLRNIIANYDGEVRKEAENRLRFIQKFESFSDADESEPETP